MTFSMPGRLDGMNETMKMPRSRYTQARRRKLIKYRIAQWIVALRVPKFTVPVRIHMHWVERDQRRDRDNIRSGAKFILDALVKQQRIVNDSQKWVTELTDSYSVDKVNPRIEVTIEPAIAEPTTSSAAPGSPEGFDK